MFYWCLVCQMSNIWHTWWECSKNKNAKKIYSYFIYFFSLLPTHLSLSLSHTHSNADLTTLTTMPRCRASCHPPRHATPHHRACRAIHHTTPCYHAIGTSLYRISLNRPIVVGFAFAFVWFGMGFKVCECGGCGFFFLGGKHLLVPTFLGDSHFIPYILFLPLLVPILKKMLLVLVPVVTSETEKADVANGRNK